MGNTACCKTDSRNGFQSQIIQLQNTQIPAPALPVNREAELYIEQYIRSHPTIKRILNDKQVCQQLQKNINIINFLSEARVQKIDQGVFIGKKLIDNGKKTGNCILIYQDSSYYEGQMRNDHRHGKGILVNQNGQYYVGDWVEDYPHGQGIHCILNPYAYYKGEWSQGLKHGQGSQHSPDGSMYVGSFVYGQKQGQGKLIYSDKTEYQGQFKSGKPDGLGKFIGKSHSYEGNWKNGKMHGAGASEWHNQKKEIIGKYIGQYRQGIKQGYGQFTDSHHKVYKAMWRNGQINESAPIQIQKQT